MAHIESNALALEHKLVKGTARRNLDVFNLVNNPFANGKCRVLGLGLEEEARDLAIGDLRSFGDNAADSLLVVRNSV